MSMNFYFFEYFLEVDDHIIRGEAGALSGFAVDVFHLTKDAPLMQMAVL